MEFEEVENIGQRIKEIRKSKSITIQKLSQFTDLSVGYLEQSDGAEPGKPDTEQSAAHLRGAWYFDSGSAQSFRRGENPDPPGGAAVI